MDVQMNKQTIGKSALITDGLSKLLAETYVLYLKTQNFHWNVTGPMFYNLHLLFETQYKEYALAIDVIAERIRSLGSLTPGSFAAYQKLSRIKEELTTPKALQMLEILSAGNKILVGTIKKIIPLAQEAGDEASADLLIERMNIHEKNIWMLDSHLVK